VVDDFDNCKGVSNPDQARSQRVVSCSGLREEASQIVHGSRAMPTPAKTAVTHSRSVLGRHFTVPTLSQR